MRRRAAAPRLQRAHAQPAVAAPFAILPADERSGHGFYARGTGLYRGLRSTSHPGIRCDALRPRIGRMAVAVAHPAREWRRIRGADPRSGSATARRAPIDGLDGDRSDTARTGPRPVERLTPHRGDAGQ